MITPPYKLVIIHWLDAHSIDAWEQLEGEKKNVECISVGWLVNEGKDNIVIVPHIADKSDSKFDGCGKMIIPRTAIIKIKKIKP
jgi:hypothetical protein